MQANPRWANVDFRSIYRLVLRFDLGVYLDFNLIYDWDICGYTLVPIGQFFECSAYSENGGFIVWMSGDHHSDWHATAGESTGYRM